MAYGVTSAGFSVKRLPDILVEIQDALRAELGAGINLDPRAPLGQIAGILAERYAQLWEGLEAIYNGAYPATAEGASLDRAVALTGITRKPAIKSTAIAYAYGTPGTVIPVRSVVSVSGNSAARFETDAAATIAAAVNEVQTLTFSHVPTGGAYALTFGGETTGALAYNADAAAIQAALRLLSLTDVTVSGTYGAGFTVTFAGVDGGMDQPTLGITSNTLTRVGGGVTMMTQTTVPGAPPQATLLLTAQEAGAVAAPAGSLDVIATPISGWDTVFNALDATIGNDVETDAELRARQAATVQRTGAGTVEAIKADLLQLPDVTACSVFENSTMDEDGFGRPAKSFEVIISGGDDDVIAQAIWADKPAGIATYGSTTVVITDSMGFDHDISFSRPTEVPIYLEIDVETTDDYPADGDARVEAEALAYGASLGLGNDVVVYPALIARIANVPGIVDVDIRVGTAASPTLDDNVAISTFELRSLRLHADLGDVDMTEYTQITTHVDGALARLLEQYREAPKIRALVSTFAAEAQALEDAIAAFGPTYGVTTATGAHLDRIGVAVGFPRPPGIDDATYRVFVIAQIGINSSQGETERVIAIYKLITNATTVRLTEYPPAAFSLFSDGTIPEGLGETVVKFIAKAGPAGVAVNDIAIGVYSGTNAFTIGPSDSGGGFGSLSDPDAGGGFGALISA